MDFNPSRELWIFLSFFISGSLCSALFDFFRAFRKNIKMNTFFVFISDILFWILVTFLTAFCVFFLNGGLLRTFVICAFLIGSVLYFFTLGRILFPIICKIMGIICHFIDLFLKILLTPFKFSYKIILVWLSKTKNNSGVKE